MASEIDFDVRSNNICLNSRYVYGPTGHVITGNLCIIIIKNKGIRQLLIKGPSYREQNNVNWNRILLDPVRAYKVQWAKKEHFEVRTLNEWHSKISEYIVNKISTLEERST